MVGASGEPGRCNAILLVVCRIVVNLSLFDVSILHPGRVCTSSKSEVQGREILTTRLIIHVISQACVYACWFA